MNNETKIQRERSGGISLPDVKSPKTATHAGSPTAPPPAVGGLFPTNTFPLGYRRDHGLEDDGFITVHSSTPMVTQ